MNKFHDRAIARCLEDEQELSEWEIDFLKSLAEQVQKRDLTDKQVSVLHRILLKVEFES